MYGGSVTNTRNSTTFLAEVIATKNAAFIERSSKEDIAVGSKDEPINLVSTQFRSQGGVGSLTCGYNLSKPYKNLIDLVLENTGWSAVGGWKEELAAR